MNILAQTLDLGGDGPSVAIKDTIDIAGYPTMAGSRALDKAAPAAHNAAIVARILSSGCKIVGKTNLHELAFGVTGINDWTGTPINPRFPTLVPGGSSSGSAAAVAAGIADFAIGTDTGGSIRIPAACCGVYGFKPTFGRISRVGVLPSQSSLDCVGPLANTAEWLIRAMGNIDPSFSRVEPRKFTVGLIDVPAEASLLKAVTRAVASVELTVRPMRLAGLEAAFDAGLTIINAENWSAFAGLVEAGRVGEDVATRLRRAATTSPTDVAAAESVRAAFQAEVDALFDHVDVLILPTMPCFPPDVVTARSDRSAVRMTQLVRPFNLSGHPAATVPLPTSEGLPAGLQVVGRRGRDAEVLAVVQRIAG